MPEACETEQQIAQAQSPPSVAPPLRRFPIGGGTARRCSGATSPGRPPRARGSWQAPRIRQERPAQKQVPRNLVLGGTGSNVCLPDTQGTPNLSETMISALSTSRRCLLPEWAPMIWILASRPLVERQMTAAGAITAAKK